MTDILGIKSFAIANSIYALLRHVERDGMLDEMVEAIDNLADTNLSQRSEQVQQRLVEKVLLPLAQKLMKEDPRGFNSILTRFQYLSLDKSVRGGEERRENYRGESKRGLPVQPKH